MTSTQNDTNLSRFRTIIFTHSSEIVENFIKDGFNVNEKDKYGDTALHYAIAYNRPEIIDILITNGADITTKDRFGYPLLKTAIMSSSASTNIIAQLIAHGADVNEKDHFSRTPAYYAVTNNKPAALEILIANGVDLTDKIDYTNETSLQIAAGTGQIEIIKFLITHGLSIHSVEDEPLLHISARENQLETVEFLIEQGVDINAKYRSGNTALDSAALEGHDQMVDLLLKHGVNYNIDTTIQREKSIDLYTKYYDYPHIFKLFLEAVTTNATKVIYNLLKHHQEFYQDVMHLAHSQNKTEIVTFLNQQALPIVEINNIQFMRLLDNRTSTDIVLKDLLDQHKFSNHLTEFRFNASNYNNISSIDFSGLDLSGSRLYGLVSNQMIFKHTNLTNANIVLNNNATTNFWFADLSRSFIKGLNLNKTNLDNAIIKDTMIPNSYSYAEKLENYKGKIIDLKIESSFQFKQNDLIKKYPVLNKNGVCFGLAIEYTIEQLANPSIEQSNFIEKIKNNINNEDKSFLYRVQSYHKNIQADFNKMQEQKIAIDTDEVLNNNFLASLPDEVKTAKIIGCGVSAANSNHIFVISQIQNNETLKYNIFDSNIGEFICDNAKELNKKINFLFQFYKSTIIDRNSDFKVMALDKFVMDLGLIAVNSNQDLEITRYSLMSAQEKLYMFLDNTKANSAEIHQAIEMINNMSLEEINSPIIRGNGNSVSLIYLAAQGIKPDIIELLITKGADYQMKSTKGYTALYAGVIADSPEIIDILVKHGTTTILSERYDNRTLLHYAAMLGKVQALKSLMAYGMDIEALDLDDRNALLLAAYNGHKLVIEELLLHDTNIDKQDKYGYSSLYIAAAQQHVNTTITLITHGANPYLQNNENKTAIDIRAKYFSNEAISNLCKDAVEQNNQLALNNMFKHYYNLEIQNKLIAHTVAQDIVEYLPEKLKFIIESDEVCYNLNAFSYLTNEYEYSF